MPTSPTIENISDTALWVAHYRAVETDRPDAHFRDPYARRLSGARGEAMVRSLPGGGRMGWAMVVRTVLLDELLTRLISQSQVDAVLCLATGLDSRPWRMDLPASLRWFDVDLPAILAYKHGMLRDERPRCRLEPRAVDLTDQAARRALFAEVAAAGNVLVMSEGLLIYLDAEEVAGLARDLRAQATFRWWLFDLASPPLLRMLDRTWAPQLRAANAPFKFGPAEGTRFFEPFGWKEAEYRSFWDESRRLKREIPRAWLWRFLGRFASAEQREQWRRFSGVVLMEPR